MSKYEKMSVDELIAESIALKEKIAELRNERIAIKNEIGKRNAEEAATRVLDKLSPAEKGILRDKLNTDKPGSGDITVTPQPATLKMKGH